MRSESIQKSAMCMFLGQDSIRNMADIMDSYMSKVDCVSMGFR